MKLNFMRIVCLLFLLFFIPTLSEAQSLKMMTYNLRLNIASDGVNAWPNRKEKVISLIKKSNPDAFGVQEALHDQMQDVVKALPEYAYVGVGRDDGREKGEYTAIFYKKDRLKVLKSSSFWLSETPEVPGSIGWDAAITRMATWAQVEDVQTKKTFLMATTHFDHMGKVARVKSAEALSAWISKVGVEQKIPVILCGDFNFQPTEEPYTKLVAKQAPLLLDARPAQNNSGTFCGFAKGKMDCLIIDYVFHTEEWVVNSFEVLGENDGTYYPSDHLPVVVVLALRQ